MQAQKFLPKTFNFNRLQLARMRIENTSINKKKLRTRAKGTAEEAGKIERESVKQAAKPTSGWTSNGENWSVFAGPIT